VCKQSVKFGLLRNELFPDGNNFGDHLVNQPLHVYALLIRQSELRTKLQDMTRPRIAIQFGGKRQTHSSPGVQIGDLFGRQCLDRAGLQARIAPRRLCRDIADRQRKARGSNECKHAQSYQQRFHVTLLCRHRTTGRFSRPDRSASLVIP
jgi:hypothetical protein